MVHSGVNLEWVTRLVLDELRRAGAVVAPAAPVVPVSVSGRHLHLCRADLETLFGPGAALTVEKPISQPGQFASGQFVSVSGPKGDIQRLRVLGPLRPQTQVELAVSEARRLGLTPPVRQSGALDGTPGVTLTGPAGSVTLTGGVIVAERHIHMTPAQAGIWGLLDGQRVRVRLDTPKGGVLDQVFIRVREDFALDMHLDTDDANAFLVGADCRAEILRE